MREKGATTRKIGEQLRFSREQIKGFIKRRNRKNRMIEAGQAIHKKGRPCKNQDGSLPPSIQHKRNVQMLWLKSSFPFSKPNASTSTTITVCKPKQN